MTACAPSIYRARRLTRSIALGHYENFTVVSLALPRKLRQDFYNIYAFCRHADDLADEIESSRESLQRLSRLRKDLIELYGSSAACGFAVSEVHTASDPSRVILTALQETINRYQIPIGPFLALIDAFEQDRRVGRYETYADLLDYCRRSANPVGHLVLYLCGYRDSRRQELSDLTCTALQLTNFWQDVVPDLRRGRIYLPLEDMRRFDVSEQDLHGGVASAGFVEMMKFQVDRTEALFVRGEALLPLVDRRLRTDIALFGRGGRAVLERIRAIGYNVLGQRPTLGRWAKLALFARVLLNVSF